MAPIAMATYNHEDLPYYYSLANQFAVADRYFASLLSQTLPNRYFLFAGTSFGRVTNTIPPLGARTIFHVLNDHKISWKYYRNGFGYLVLFNPFYLFNQNKMKTVEDYAKDLQSGNLPQVVFIDSSAEGLNEYPGSNIQLGQVFVAQQIKALVESTYWKKSALFLSYDENGGFYDHVPPPEACVPDERPPILKKNSIPGKFDRYGFRVPFVAVSPYAKHHYVSHKVYDHTSILKFIETKFNLPALTSRDANADGLMDLFDFKNPIMEVNLPEATVDPARDCNKPE
jgi:phospholipase C